MTSDEHHAIQSRRLEWRCITLKKSESSGSGEAIHVSPSRLRNMKLDESEKYGSMDGAHEIVVAVKFTKFVIWPTSM